MKGQLWGRCIVCQLNLKLTNRKVIMNKFPYVPHKNQWTDIYNYIRLNLWIWWNKKSGLDWCFCRKIITYIYHIHFHIHEMISTMFYNDRYFHLETITTYIYHIHIIQSIGLSRWIKERNYSKYNVGKYTSYICSFLFRLTVKKCRCQLCSHVIFIRRRMRYSYYSVYLCA